MKIYIFPTEEFKQTLYATNESELKEMVKVLHSSDGFSVRNQVVDFEKNKITYDYSGYSIGKNKAWVHDEIDFIVLECVIKK